MISEPILPQGRVRYEPLEKSNLIFQPFRLILCAVLRFIFVLLFMKCNIAKNDDAPEPWFQSDIIFIIIMALFSFTNGLFSSIGKSFSWCNAG